MPDPIVGLHHVTVIASDPQRNLDFYTELLGLRLVKRTVNFDDPGTYHFYFGDDTGSPGTLLTFFPWPHATRGSGGVGETSATSFSVPAESLAWWEKRLLDAGIPAEKSPDRFGKPVLAFADSDGVKLELIGDATGAAPNPPRHGVPAEHAIHGFSGVTLCEAGFDLTAAVLEKMGYRQTASEGNRYRFASSNPAPFANYIDILVQTQLTYGRMGAGSVHHIAFRAPTDDAQVAWREELKSLHLNITPVLDRTYFHSIYFREPGGVLFEIATDPPGFSFDEPVETLGESLKLPPWLETRRNVIENLVPPITLHYQK